MIEMAGLTKQFRDLVAVAGITLTVESGQVLALLGPNGAGKTTTVRMLASILKPTHGWARVAGYDVVSQGQEVRRRVGLLTEAPGLYSKMTGREYLDFFGQLYEMPTRLRAARIKSLTDQFHIGSELLRHLGEYSKGMQQKIALVRALLHDPAVLLLDEPTSGMDPENASLVHSAILGLRSAAEHTIILCTHNLSEVEALSDRIAIVQHGRLIAQGTASELKAHVLGPPLMELRLATRHAPAMDDGIHALVQHYGNVEARGDGWIRYRAPDPAVANPRLLKALTEADIPVLTLSEVPRSLESAYLQAIAEGTASHKEAQPGGAESSVLDPPGFHRAGGDSVTG